MRFQDEVSGESVHHDTDAEIEGEDIDGGVWRYRPLGPPGAWNALIRGTVHK